MNSNYLQEAIEKEQRGETLTANERQYLNNYRGYSRLNQEKQSKEMHVISQFTVPKTLNPINDFVPTFKLERPQGDGSTTQSSSYVEGGAYSAVGSNGKVGLVVKHSTYTTPTTYPTELRAVNGSTSVKLDSTGLIITASTGNTCTVNFAGITRSLSIREIDVCDAGTAKKMLILGSAPY